MDKFRKKQDEANFILSTIDVTDGLGPMRIADHHVSLRDVMAIMRIMAVDLGTVSRNHRDLVTSDDIASMTADLDAITARRKVCLKDLDEKSEARRAVDIDPDSKAHSEGEHVASEDIPDFAKEPEEIAAPVKCVEPSGLNGEVETPAFKEAPDDAIKEVITVAAANAETPAVAEPHKRVSSLLNFFEKHTEMSDAPKPFQAMAKEGDPPWFKDKMLRLLDLQMQQMMSSLGSEPCPSSFSTMAMANLLMRASLHLCICSRT